MAEKHIKIYKIFNLQGNVNQNHNELAATLYPLDDCNLKKKGK